MSNEPNYRTFYLVNASEKKSYLATEKDFNFFELRKIANPGDVVELVVVETYSREYMGILSKIEKPFIIRQEEICETGFLSVKGKAKKWLENQGRVNKITVADPICSNCLSRLNVFSDVLSVAQYGRCNRCRLPCLEVEVLDSSSGDEEGDYAEE